MLSSSCTVLLLFLAAGGWALSSNDPNLCHYIINGRDFDYWKNCTYRKNGIGNLYGDRFILLDFSKTTDQEINDFFAKPTEDNVRLMAGILIAQSAITSVDFGNVTQILLTDVQIADATVRYGYVPLLRIAENWNLKTINWNLTSIEAGNNTRIVVMNNPLLEMDETVVKLLRTMANNGSLIQIEGCTFEIIFTGRDFHPTTEQLAACKIIQGDLNLENLTLSGRLEVHNGCLRLVNVDLNNYRITAGQPKGRLNCNQFGRSSALINNTDLCGDQMQELVSYIQENGITYPSVVLDSESCTKDHCSQEEEIAHPYTLCSNLSSDAVVGYWFEQREKYQQKINAVERADNLTIRNFSNQTALKFPNLKSVTHLEIYDNDILETFEFPSLESVETMTIHGNPKWLLKEFSKNFERIPRIDMKSSHVECYTTLGDMVDDFRTVRFCTVIKGELILTNVSDTNASLFQVRQLEGCLTVRDTMLTDLWFMEAVKKISGCATEHLVQNNAQLCARGFLTDIGTIKMKNNRETGCPCIMGDVLRTGAMLPTAPKCPVIVVFKPFDCLLYRGANVEEVRGTLILQRCDLEMDFPRLEKIISSRTDKAVLVIQASSAVPTVAYLTRLESSFMAHSLPVTGFVKIATKMTIKQYLKLKYSFGETLLLSAPITTPSSCYDLESTTAGCRIFDGDLVVKEDALNETTTIEEVRGCLIVQNGTQLNFLRELERVGTTCVYHNGTQFPYSPSRGHDKMAISQMKAEFCLSRQERNRLAEITKLSVFELSGKQHGCSKSCKSLSAGNCDTFYGDLVISPADHFSSLVEIFGRLYINGTLTDVLDFPQLKRISTSTAPALMVHDNLNLQFLRMPQLSNISADDKGKPLVVVTKNPKLHSLNEFVPSGLLQLCQNDPTAACYADSINEEKAAEQLDRNLIDGIILGVILLLIVGLPILYHCLTFEKREQALEERRARRLITRKRRELRRKKAAMRRRKSLPSVTNPTSRSSESIPRTPGSESIARTPTTRFPGLVAFSETVATPAETPEKIEKDVLHEKEKINSQRSTR